MPFRFYSDVIWNHHKGFAFIFHTLHILTVRIINYFTIGFVFRSVYEYRNFSATNETLANVARADDINTACLKSNGRLLLDSRILGF